MCEAVRMALRRGSSFSARAALVVAAITSLIALSAVDVSAQDADPADPVTDVAQQADDASSECMGTITASLAAESLPSGEWSAHGDCLTGDRFYEFVEGPVLAKAAVADVVYSDGHSGRIAAGVLTLGNGLGLGIVGVEDAATGLVKWSAVLDDFEEEGDSVSVSGEGVAVFPVERATVSAQLTGTGTDIKPFLDGYQDTDVATVDPEADATMNGPDDGATPSQQPTVGESEPGSSGTAPADGADVNGTDPVPSGQDGSGAADTPGAGADDPSGGDDATAGRSGGPDTSDAKSAGIDYGVIEAP